MFMEWTQSFTRWNQYHSMSLRTGIKLHIEIHHRFPVRNCQHLFEYIPSKILLSSASSQNRDNGDVKTQRLGSLQVSKKEQLIQKRVKKWWFGKVTVVHENSIPEITVVSLEKLQVGGWNASKKILKLSSKYPSILAVVNCSIRTSTGAKRLKTFRKEVP